MHPPSTKFPRQAQLVFPLIDFLAQSGGVAPAKSAYAALAESHAVLENARAETITLGDGRAVNLWERHLRFVKLRTQAAGYLVSSGRGVWQLTDEGQEAYHKATPGVVVRIYCDEAQQPVAAQVELSVGLPTIHTIRQGDARDLSWIPEETIPLIVTSIPYFDLKQYEAADGQLGDIASYDDFIAAMADAMRECYRVLAPGGRMALNVGDVLRSRSKHGTHEVLPLSADMLVSCRKVGFQALTGIIWQKLQNCRFEGSGAGAVLGSPGMPRMCIKSETESILLFKKPGDYLTTTPEQREASRLTKEEWKKWVRPVWNDVRGARASAHHPAPYPVEIPYRLIRMFSYTGPEPDTVLDICGGAATTAIAAMRARRNSITVEIAKGYVRRGIDSISAEARRLSAAFAANTANGLVCA